MPKDAITFFGFKQMSRALKTSTAQAALRKHVARGTGRILQKLEAKIRQEIKKGVKPANAALTIALKGSSKTLVGGTAQLFQAVTHEQPAWNRGFVGVSKKSNEFDIAKMLHNGAMISVSQRMRNMFLILARATKATQNGTAMPKLTGRTRDLWALHKEWFALHPSTTQIRIPARRFVTNVTRKKAARDLAAREWTAAINAALKEMAKK